jgi:hypothetical protein
MDSAEARTSGRKARPTRKAPLKPKNGLNGPPDLSPGLSSRIARLVGVRSRCCFRLMILRDGYLYRYGGQLRSAVVQCRLRTSECRLRKGLLWARSFWGMHLFWNPSERLSSDQQGKRAVPLRRNLWLKFVDCSKLASVVETVSSSVQVAGVVQQQIPQRVAFCTGEIVRFRIDPCGTRSS